jgi:hypothetical protein
MYELERTLRIRHSPDDQWTPSQYPGAGPGRCSACDCRGFKPTGKKNDICADCGHYWQIHR